VSGGHAATSRVLSNPDNAPGRRMYKLVGMREAGFEPFRMRQIHQELDIRIDILRLAERKRPMQLDGNPSQQLEAFGFSEVGSVESAHGAHFVGNFAHPRRVIAAVSIEEGGRADTGEVGGFVHRKLVQGTHRPERFETPYPHAGVVSTKKARTRKVKAF